MLPRDPRTLATQAEQLLADCETVLESVSQSIRNIPAEREEALEAIASAREDCNRAKEEFSRVLNKDLGRWHEDVAEEKLEATHRRLSRESRYLSSDHFDLEYRKAVARQVAGLLREESLQKLDKIAACSEDPQLQQTVSDCKEGVARATRYVINMFSAPRKLQQDEVRKARAEARETLDFLKNPSMD